MAKTKQLGYLVNIGVLAIFRKTTPGDACLDLASFRLSNLE